MGPILAYRLVTFNTKLEGILSKNTNFFSNNMPFLGLVCSYNKTYLNYKPSCLKSIQEVYARGISADNSY